MPVAAKAAARKSIWPGLLLCAVLAAVAIGLSTGAWLDPIVVVLPCGILIGNLAASPALHPGARFAVRSILPAGIVLLGARLNLGDLLRIGAPALALTAISVAAALAVATRFGRLFGVGRKLMTLLGVGTAICGGSAIVAAAPVIDADERDTAFAVATVSLIGLGTMVLLPVLAHAFGMEQQAFGIWAGLSIHQTPQVIAAGFAFGEDAGRTATVVKLARVCLLAPVVLLLGRLYRTPVQRTIVVKSAVPMMVLCFGAMVVLRTLGLLPAVGVEFPADSVLGTFSGRFSLVDLCRELSVVAILTGLAGVGLETSFTSLRKVGLRPFAACAAVSVLIAAMSLAAVWLLFR